jgi:hypothetical protein
MGGLNAGGIRGETIRGSRRTPLVYELSAKKSLLYGSTVADRPQTVRRDQHRILPEAVIAIGRLRCASACRPAWHQPQDLFRSGSRRLAGQPRGALRRTQSIQCGLLQSPWTHRTRSVEPLIDEFALDRLVRELPSGAPTLVRSKSRLPVPPP